MAPGMQRICPHCRGGNVRRSSTHVDEISWRNKVLSRYRCLNCNLQFWVVSRRSYILMVSLLCALLIAGIAVVMLEIMFNPVRLPGSDGSPQTRMRTPMDIRSMGLAHIAASNVVAHAFNQT